MKKQIEKLTKKHLVGLLMIVCGSAALAIVVYQFVGKGNAPVTSVVEPGATVKVEKVPTNSTPARFPADIPIEKDAQITENFNATDPNGAVQATRGFISKKSLAENYSLYTEYLKNSGWVINNSVDGENNKFISAKKDKADIQINITESPNTGNNNISISYTEKL